MAASASSSEVEPELNEPEPKDDSLSRTTRHIDIDPHKTMCWDVSIYLDVTFDQEPCEKCMPRLDTIPTPKKHQVCNN